MPELRNRLADQGSLYLREHAGDPVAWQPWDEAARAAARDLDRPIFLSIGYASCHWCHVMQRESFRDPGVAERLNRAFVPIKVDREMRPDLDELYQGAHALFTGRAGGWPLSVFAFPDSRPFFCGTYFPPERRHGLPAFGELLDAIEHAWRTHRDTLERHAAALRRALERLHAPPAEGASAPQPERLAADLLEAADRRHGGWGTAPKFPMAPALELALRLGGAAAEHGRFTLLQLARSGLCDQLEGGFFRYCVDEAWTLPHFEMMLYDNAQLLRLYALAARRWADPLLRRAAERIADFLFTRLAHPDGGFCAALDAEADGVEGGHYWWTRRELEAALPGPEAALACRAWGLDGGDPDTPRHLRAAADEETLAARFDMTPAEVEARLEAARVRLVALRRTRVPPRRDEKRLTAWNALAVTALADAGRWLDRPDWAQAARATLELVCRRLWDGRRLWAALCDGRREEPAMLDDYAYGLRAALACLAWDGDRTLIDFAGRLADRLLDDFSDAGGFVTSRRADLPVAPRRLGDGPTPAGAAVAAAALWTLGALLDRPRWTQAAAPILATLGTAAAADALGHAGAALAWLERERGAQLKITGPRRSRAAALAPLRGHAIWTHLASLPGRGAAALSCRAGVCRSLPLEAGALRAALDEAEAAP